MLVVFCIRSLCGCKFSCHCSTITREDNTILRHDNRSLHGTAIIFVSYVTSDLLCILVTLIVSVVHAATILVNWEAFALGKAICAVMARSGGTTFNKVVTTCNLLAIGKNNLVLRSFNLWSGIPLVTNSRTNSIGAKCGLLGFLLSHFLTISGFGCLGFLGLLLVSLLLCLCTLGKNCIAFCLHLLPVIKIGIGFVELLLPFCFVLVELGYTGAHLGLIVFYLGYRCFRCSQIISHEVLCVLLVESTFIEDILMCSLRSNTCKVRFCILTFTNHLHRLGVLLFFGVLFF